MSLKYSVEKISNNEYILPKTHNMKVDVHAFLSEDLYNATEEGLWDQIANGASYEGVTGAYLAPDAHYGFGVPIGSIIVTDNTLIQASVGYDISCGILFLKVPGLTAADIAPLEKRRDWINEVEKRVGINSFTGFNSKFNSKKIDDILMHGAKTLGVQSALCERQFIKVDEKTDIHKIEKAYEKAAPQIGTIGKGNHFNELQCDTSDQVWVMVHCGSRGLGYQTADYFFYEAAKLRNLPKNQRENSWLYMDEPLGKEYWNHHNMAANYAIANRHIIIDGINEALRVVFNVEGEVYYEISHNLIQEETLVLPDGTTKKGLVHRKGSTRAMPAGHPDLVGSIWEKTGHPVCIPGSMMAGAAILFPSTGAYKSACSVNHGSGRLLARGQAKKELGPRQDDIDAEMRDIVRTFGGVDVKGILTNTRKTPLDECGHVYKDLDAVLTVLEEENIAKVHNRLYPVANIKGAD